MVDTRKFSEFTVGGDMPNNSITVGISAGSNTQFNNPWTFLASGNTASRPAINPVMYNRLRFNTDLNSYEYYSPFTATWVPLNGSGTGTVNPGTTNSIAFYPSNGQVLSPISSLPNALFRTNGSGTPSFSTTIPTGITIPGAIITGSTASLTSGQIAAVPVGPTSITNKAYVDSLVAGSVTSITGTTNQVIASSPTGAVILSLPQDIATGSSPTFSAMTLSSTTAHAVMLGQSGSPMTSVLLGAGQLLIGTTASDPVAATLTQTANQITITSASGSITIALASNPILPGTAGVTLPTGNTAARAGSAGTMRFNSQTSVFEATVDGAAWETITTTATGVTSVSGTANRITSTGGTTPVIDISAAYVGQASITTLGTITTGTWNATPIDLASFVSGNLDVSHLNSGAGATNTTFWRGDGTWAVPSNGITPSALTKNDDTNVTLTLGGTPATALLQAVTLTLGWTGTLSGTRGGTGVNNGSFTITLGGSLTTIGAFDSTFTMTGTTNVTFPVSGTLATVGATVSSITGTANQITASAATGAVTLSIASNPILPGTGGVTLPSGNTAARAGGAGTMRFNSQTNVFEATVDGVTWATIETSLTGVVSVSGTANRITSTGGTTPVIDISAAYVGQTSITTLGTITTGVWTGTNIALANGGTSASLTASNGGIVYSTASAMAILAGTATALQMLQSGANAAPTWSTATWPATTTINQILYSSAANTVVGLATANSSVLVTSAGGVPSLSTTLPNINIGTPTAGVLTNTTGGGGLRSFQVFTSGTAATYTKPAGVTSILVEVVGGGGGGGGATGGASTASVAGGGGGGGYARLWVAAASGTYTYTVGAGGTAGSSGGGAGGTGGTTTFSASSLQATGGTGGNGNTNTANGVQATGTGGGPGGVGSNGNINVKGGPGGWGSTTFAGAGFINPGAGGNSHYGGGGNTTSSGTGDAGGTYGGGGASGWSFASNTAGGAGAAGVIIVWEFA